MNENEKSCINCKNVNICIFRVKLHTEFSDILRYGIDFNTLEKVYEVFANDCELYEEQKEE